MSRMSGAGLRDMIQYTLRCDEGHSFDSWFKSSAAFETLVASGHVTCAICGSGEVSKAMMSPRVTTGRKKAAEPVAKTKPAEPQRRTQHPMAVAPDPDVQRAIAELRKRVERDSDFVGDSFATEARAMHLGEAPERSIYGQATVEEARSLVEDGVPVMPLPFMPTRKTN